MKRGYRLLLLLYPREWRQRYARELEGLLEDARLTSSDPFDSAKGAIFMRMHSISSKPVWQIVLALALIGAIAGGATSTQMEK